MCKMNKRITDFRIWVILVGSLAALGGTARSVAEPPASCVAVLIDDDLSTGWLTQYVNDLRARGYTTVYTDTVDCSTADPESIKSWIQQQYDQGARGVVFVGDIPAAFVEVLDDGGQGTSVFASDLFYMDLDGHWEDEDGDGDYDVHTAGDGDEGPEIYVGHLYVSTVADNNADELIADYFAKAHAYRTGQLKQPWRGLVYLDDPYADEVDDLSPIYGDNVVRRDSECITTASDYLDQLNAGQHFVHLHAHGSNASEHFRAGSNDTVVYAHVYAYSPVTHPNSNLLLGSDDGIKVWLNGQWVCTHDAHNHGFCADEWTEEGLTLNAGWNQLLCKVSQDASKHEFSARFTDWSGETLSDLTYQVDDPDTHAAHGEFIRDWLLNGFHADSEENWEGFLHTNYLGDNNEEDGNPYDGQLMGGCEWTTFHVDGAYVDMTKHCGPASWGVCYAFARVHAYAPTACELWLGYDDGARVWLNGRSVYSDDDHEGAWQPDIVKLDVNLLAGENRLMVKISQREDEHGFSARFCHEDGSPVAGLTYDPPAQPVSYIYTWLMNGPYCNPDAETRLSYDYLGSENEVRPSEGDGAPLGSWVNTISATGCPVDIHSVYEEGSGGTVWYEDIQTADPNALFYNLLSCNNGRFMSETGYMAGAYIFHTSSGLIAMGYSRTGAMNACEDFYEPLGGGSGKPFGDAFAEWFDAHTPLSDAGRWAFYGMILHGDPTLRAVRIGDIVRDGNVDLSDLAALLAAYDTCEGDSGYDPAADLDWSGCVDLSDLSLLLANWDP